jgi:hypothetical protein
MEHDGRIPALNIPKGKLWTGAFKEIEAEDEHRLHNEKLQLKRPGTQYSGF